MWTKRIYPALTVCLIGGASLAIAADQSGHQSPAPGTNREAMSAIEDAAGAASGMISAEMTTTTKGFVTAAAMSDMYEVEAGKIAAQRSRNDAIKSFAQEMVKAHGKTTSEIKSILLQEKINVAPPAQLDSRRQRMIDNLKGAKDEDFDGRYLNQQSDAHREALVLTRGYAKDGDNAALKGFAAKTTPIVQSHLNMVEALDKANADQKGSAG
jgi:putative membrane protein